MKKRSEFDKWFVAQFGNRPSKKTVVALEKDTLVTHHHYREAVELRDDCILWDERRQAARYAYNAFKGIK